MPNSSFAQSSAQSTLCACVISAGTLSESRCLCAFWLSRERSLSPFLGDRVSTELCDPHGHISLAERSYSDQAAEIFCVFDAVVVLILASQLPCESVRQNRLESQRREKREV